MTVVEKEAPAGGGVRPARWAALLHGAGEVRNLGLLGVLLVLGVIGTVTQSTFLTNSNILTILTSASVAGVVTVGMTFVIIGGGIDLSVGALVALASVWSTTVATQSYGAGVMVLCALLVGTVSGLVNGLLIAYGRLVPFIVTLATMVGARGLAQKLSDKKTQIVTVQSINNLATDKVLGVPVLVYLFACVVVLGWVLLNLTTYGRRTYAIGGNPEAARLAGLNVRLHTATLYALSGLCCGIAAVMITARTTTGSSTHGNLYELDAIAAVIIGGTLLSGGRGTLVGSVLGVLVFTTVQNIFVLNDLKTEVQSIAKCLIILAAVLFQTWSARWRRTPTTVST